MVWWREAGVMKREWGMGNAGSTGRRMHGLRRAEEALHGLAPPDWPQRTLVPYSPFPIPAPPPSHVVLGHVQPARLVLLPALAQRFACGVVGRYHFEHALERAFHRRIAQVDHQR